MPEVKIRGVEKKAFYSTAGDNRLVLGRRGFASLTAGRFSVKDNRLSYILPNGSRIPFDGEWSLDEKHNLVFFLRDDGDASGRIVLRGKIISARAGVLAFEASGVNESGMVEWQVFELYGHWDADPSNRLAFTLRKGGSPGRLVLRASWEVGSNQEIVYTYTRETLKRTGLREKITVTFSGYWQIYSRNRIVYSLCRSSGEGFAFKVCLQTPSLYPADGKIKYRLGAGVSQGRDISLYGQWKFGRRFNLAFEMRYGPGSKERIYFDAGFKNKRGDSLAFRLKTLEGKFSGISLLCSRASMAADNTVRMFAEFVLKNDEKAVNAGVEFEF